MVTVGDRRGGEVKIWLYVSCTKTLTGKFKKSVTDSRGNSTTYRSPTDYSSPTIKLEIDEGSNWVDSDTRYSWNPSTMLSGTTFHSPVTQTLWSKWTRKTVCWWRVEKQTRRAVVHLSCTTQYNHGLTRRHERVDFLINRRGFSYYGNCESLRLTSSLHEVLLRQQFHFRRFNKNRISTSSASAHWRNPSTTRRRTSQISSLPEIQHEKRQMSRDTSLRRFSSVKKYLQIRVGTSCQFTFFLRSCSAIRSSK